MGQRLLIGGRKPVVQTGQLPVVANQLLHYGCRFGAVERLPGGRRGCVSRRVAAQALRTRAVTRTPIHLMETDYPATDAVSSATRHRAQTGAVVLSPDVTSTASGAMTPRISVIVSEGTPAAVSASAKCPATRLKWCMVIPRP